MMCSTSLPAPLELFGASFMSSFDIVFLAALVFSLWCWAFHSPHPKLCSHSPWASLKLQGLFLPHNLLSPSCCPGLMTWCLQHPAKPAVGTWGARDGVKEQLSRNGSQQHPGGEVCHSMLSHAKPAVLFHAILGQAVLC